jgi:hypothetical protein
LFIKSSLSFVQVYVDKLVKVAYENWENVVEYDGEALVGVSTYPAAKGIDTHTEDPITPIANPSPTQSHKSNQQSTLHQIQQPPLAPLQQRPSTSSAGLCPLQ